MLINHLQEIFNCFPFNNQSFSFALCSKMEIPTATTLIVFHFYLFIYCLYYCFSYWKKGHSVSIVALEMLVYLDVF